MLQPVGYTPGRVEDEARATFQIPKLLQKEFQDEATGPAQAPAIIIRIDASLMLRLISSACGD